LCLAALLWSDLAKNQKYKSISHMALTLVFAFQAAFLAWKMIGTWDSCYKENWISVTRFVHTLPADDRIDFFPAYMEMNYRFGETLLGYPKRENEPSAPKRRWLFTNRELVPRQPPLNHGVWHEVPGQACMIGVWYTSTHANEIERIDTSGDYDTIPSPELPR
jgi:hypothetical protein